MIKKSQPKIPFVLCLLPLYLLTTLPINLSAQKAKTVKVKAQGKWEISNEITPKQAEEKALFEAKKNAIMNAGGSTEVRSLSFFSIMSRQEHFADEETFAQLNSVFVNGLVKILKYEYKRETLLGTNSQTVIAFIEAEVTLEQKSNPEFVLEINGIKNFYKNGDALQFSVWAYKNCYLRAFWFDNTHIGKGELFYPHDIYNEDIMLEEKKIYHFPLDNKTDKKAQNGDLVIERNSVVERSRNNQIEKNIILMVATKKKIPFTGECTYNNFFTWYYKISSEERSEIQGFLINITE